MFHRFIFTIFLVSFFTSSISLNAEGIEGKWIGKLDITPQVSLRIGLDISKNTAGEPVVTMDSPDQGAYGIPAETDFLSTDSIALRIPSIQMTYSGRLKNDEISGIFSQGPLSLPLILQRNNEDPVFKRPQTPQPPFPYTTEDLILPGGDEDILLGGTLTLPENYSSQTPCVVMVTGSGLNNRDEEIFGHKPFAVIADFLARNGIASFRYDDRGTGQSTGEHAETTTATKADDARVVLNYLNQNRQFSKTGLLGHSEGGLVALMLANDNKTMPDFIIGIGTPSLRGDSILIDQNIYFLKKGGMPQQIIDDYQTALSKILQYRIDNPGCVIPEEIWAEICPEWGNKLFYKELLSNLKNGFGSPLKWLDYFIAYSPSQTIKSVNIPALLLYGEKDTQVNSKLNAPVVQSLNPAITVEVLTGLNHLMQNAKTGDITEYNEIEETISPEVLQKITDFINSQ